MREWPCSLLLLAFVLSPVAVGEPQAPDRQTASDSRITGHRSNYFLVDVETGEVKFQLSVRAKLLKKQRRGWLGRYQPYFGYTQKSFWEIAEDSSPFRESNYNPELFFLREREMEDGWRYARFQFGIDHESNGLGGPDSRSWNRLYVEPTLAWRRPGRDHDSFVLALRLWPVTQISSENEDIRDFYGPGELHAEVRFKTVTLGVTGRLGDGGKGLLLTHFAYTPPEVNLRIYAQVRTGYGDSLIDYNKKPETSFRVGLMLTTGRPEATLR